MQILYEKSFGISLGNYVTLTVLNLKPLHSININREKSILLILPYIYLRSLYSWCMAQTILVGEYAL